MTSTIELLKTQINGGLRKNKYEIYIDLPDNSNGEKINLMCKASSFPERTISTVEYWHYGRSVSLRAETTYAKTWDVTFYDDSKMNIRRLFDKWMIMIDNSRKTTDIQPNIQAVNVQDYHTNIMVYQLDGEGNHVYGNILYYAFPTNLSQITYDDSENDTVVEFNVTFTYSEMAPIDGSGQLT